MCCEMQSTIGSLDDLKVVNALKILRPVVTNQSLKTRIKLLAIFGERGSSVIYVTADDHRVYGYGENRFGCLGVGRDDRNIPVPTLISTLNDQQVVNIYYGFGHCLALTSDGRVWAWGQNDFGQLGVGTFDPSNTPLELNSMSGRQVVDITCGNRHTMALTRDGVVYSWGRNTLGQCGDQTYCWRLFPIRVSSIGHKVKQISCGKCHSLALTTAGHVYVWGFNDYGQLGRHRDNDLLLGKQRAISNRPKLIPGFETIVFKKAVCGPNHTMLLTTDGDLYTCGNNEWGQIGNNTQDTQWTPVKISSKMKVKDIVAIYDNNLSIAVGVNNKYYVWGYPFGYQRISKPKLADIQPSDGHHLQDIYVKYSGSFRTFKTIVFNEEIKDNVSVVDEANTQNGQPFSTRSDRWNDTQSDVFGDDISVKTYDSGVQIRDRLSPTTSLSIPPLSSPSKTYLSEMTALYMAEDVDPMVIFMHRLSLAFNNLSNYDLVFVFANDVIYCHKTIVKIRNNKFWLFCDNLLANNTHNSMETSLVRMNTDSYDTYYSFIQFLYGLQPDINATNAADLLALATDYDEPMLKKWCKQYMNESVVMVDNVNKELVIDVSNVCQHYEKAINDNLFDLQKLCIDFIKSGDNLIAICRSDSFRALPDYHSKRLMLSF